MSRLELEARVRQRDVDVSFDVEPGETVALLGPNGAGKSTTLAVAAGLLRPDAGRVVLGDRTLLSTEQGVDVPPHRRQVALLAQDALLFPHLSVRDNVAFGPRSSGTGRTRSGRLAQEWLERVGAADLAQRRPAHLSGGQAQRVAVARALATEPRLLLLDEPLSALDVAIAPSLRQTLRQVLVGRTTLLVTHDVLDALLLADRVVVLEGGRVVEQGRTHEVLTRPRSAFAARLAGINLLEGTWDGERLVLADGGIVHGMPAEPAPGAGAGAVATFGPQAVAIYRESTGGSPRNSFTARIEELEPQGDRIRVRCGALSADVTLQAAAELALVPGDEVTLRVKATEVSVYGR
jgi:molybdate transport system ATP-binding protein